MRIDSHAYTGYVVPPYYDSLIAKIITVGATRLSAIDRMRRALEEYYVTGIKTTVPFHAAIMRNGPLSSSGGPSVLTTKVPAPWRDCKTPNAANEPMPARNVGRLTPSSLASSLSAGKRSPGRRSPRWIISRSLATTSSELVPRLPESMALKIFGSRSFT